MAIKDWNGFKKSGDTFIPNDATARAGVTATVDLLKDTTGWIGGNLLNGKSATKTGQGVTWTVNESDNNIVTVSGTPTGFEPLTIDSNNVLPVGEYVLSGISDMVNVVYNGVFLYKGNTLVRDLQIQDNNAPRTFSILQSDDYDTICVQLKRSNNGVACSGTGKLMITTPEQYALNPAYRPYHGSVEEVKADKTGVISALEDTVGWVGKNKIPFPYNLSDVSGSGITFTADANGIVDADGTTSGVSSLYFSRRDGVAGNKMLLSAGTWKVVGGKSSNMYLSVGYTENNAYKVIGTDQGNGFVFTLTEPTYIQISLDIYNTTVSHEKISPMVCTKEQYDLSPTYEPYHASVAEMLATKDVTVTAGTDVTVNANTHVYSKAGVVTGSLRLEIGATLTAGATIATLSAIPKNTTYAIGIDNTDKSVIPIIIGNNGAVQLFGGFIPTSGNQLLIPIAYATA